MYLRKLKRKQESEGTHTISRFSKVITRSSTYDERLRGNLLNTIASGAVEEDNKIMKVFHRHGLDKIDGRTIKTVSDSFEKGLSFKNNLQ